MLSVSGGYAHLQDVSGKDLGRSACSGALLVGSELKIGGKDVEIESMISKADFLAGRLFLGSSAASPPTLKEVNETTRVTNKEQAKYDKMVGSQKERFIPPAIATKASKAIFKAPTISSDVQPERRDPKVPTPRHDPNGVNALVMRRPRNVLKGRQIVDVVVDPLLTRNLREHQRVGVAFMYECVMGMKDYDGEGAILADEMGLGKTLQTIALLWTLMKQNPIFEAPPVVRKALIVCPVTLIKNWRKEFAKWLGRDRIGVFIMEDKKSRLSDFTRGKQYSVMIVGYEKLRMIQSELQKVDDIDIVIADEGHRLKTEKNKSAQAIKSLSTERRIILSGTPIQNDLSEFFTVVDFVNPSVFGKYSTFKKEFETAILKGQQPGASAKEQEKGEARSDELKERTDKFILRRTAEVLAKYLPSKTEYVLFCRPTKAQISIYGHVIGSVVVSDVVRSPALALGVINILKKVCNSPSLLLKKGEKDEETALSELVNNIPRNLLQSSGPSGKLQALESLLYGIRNTTQEKVVLISNYTSTMDVLASLLTSKSYKYLRLDGSTPQNKRQDLVDRFNRSPVSNSFVFLLSAKAGGTGLNLIGASRLILFDIDWNPATDLQAMARVHRDGQTRPCYIYRLLTQGALDEKIFQRQASKTGLADSIVDGKASVSSFTRDELRDLFTLDESQDCQTHRLLGCDCYGNGMPVNVEEDESAASSNDVAAFSRAETSDEELVFDEDGVEILDLQDEDHLPELPTYERGLWRSGKDYDSKAEDAGVRQNTNERNKMLSLMRYTHLDTSSVDSDQVNIITHSHNMSEGDEEIYAPDPLEGAVEDAILRGALREQGQRIGFVFSKLSS